MFLKMIIVIKNYVSYGLVLKKYIEKEKITQELKRKKREHSDMRNFLFEIFRV